MGLWLWIFASIWLARLHKFWSLRTLEMRKQLQRWDFSILWKQFLLSWKIGQKFSALEPVILQAIHHIFTNSIMEFYEEAMSLSCDLTTKHISADMWKMLEVMYTVFQRDGFDYFSDMMPALHNYVTVDTKAFLSSPDYMMAMFNMAKTMLEGDPGEDPECHAAKLLEVIILQCKGHNIDQVIPIFVELVLKRLTREIKTSELRTMCLQVIIAALSYNPALLLATLNKMGGDVFAHFVQQWIHDTDCFI